MSDRDKALQAAYEIACLQPEYFHGNALRVESVPDAGTDMVSKHDHVVVIRVNDFNVIDPYASECGRFYVDPEEAYGISDRAAQRMRAFNGIALAATDVEVLAHEYAKYVHLFGLPKGYSADTLLQIMLQSAWAIELQIKWVTDFCNRWDHAMGAINGATSK